MSDPSVDPRYLELFPAWLRSLGEDAAVLGLMVGGDAPEPLRRYVAAGLNYIFKSLDLIPDGIDDLGFMDDAFVLRVAASLALAESPAGKDGRSAAQSGQQQADALARLAEDARAVKDFLGDDYARLESYVKSLRKGAARGRTVEDIINESDTRKAFTEEVRAWATAYQAPSFTRDVKTLIKLKAFLSAKLP